MQHGTSSTANNNNNIISHLQNLKEYKMPAYQSITTRTCSWMKAVSDHANFQPPIWGKVFVNMQIKHKANKQENRNYRIVYLSMLTKWKFFSINANFMWIIPLEQWEYKNKNHVGLITAIYLVLRQKNSILSFRIKHLSLPTYGETYLNISLI